MEGYKAGINLGYWLDLFGIEPSEWFYINSKASIDMGVRIDWIKESDIAQIASWGFDHVRLPFNYDLFVDDIKPDNYMEDRLQILDDVLMWCKKYRLNLIMDLHKAPGYYFFNADLNIPNPLLNDPAYQKRFIDIWRMLAHRYIAEGDNLAFELLNEVVEPPASRWDAIAGKAIDTIREIDDDRTILYGGINYNSVYSLKDMEIRDDPRIVFNFHFYEPLLFTHQLIWPPICQAYNRQLQYPGEFHGLDEFLIKNPQYAEGSKRYIGRRIDKETMWMDFKPVADFIKTHPYQQLYCGEFGVNKRIPAESKRAWLSDIVDIFNELKIGHAAWDYVDSMDNWFGLCDPVTRKPLDHKIIEILVRRA